MTDAYGLADLKSDLALLVDLGLLQAGMDGEGYIVTAEGLAALDEKERRDQEAFDAQVRAEARGIAEARETDRLAAEAADERKTA